MAKKSRPGDDAPKRHHLTDAEFFAILRENAGLFARTARAIEQQYKVPYTRQSVSERAKRHPEELADIIEETIDIAEEGLNTLMRTGTPSIKLRAIVEFLKAKGKGRGYYDRVENVFTVPPEQIVGISITEAMDKKGGK
jgi:hypothetical protein